MKTVYAFTPEGLYCGQAVAFESPLEPGKYHFPVFTTDVEPPVTPEGKVTVWDGNAWSLIDAPLSPEPELGLAINEIPIQPEPAKPETPPPTSIHAAYFRAALAQMGKLDAVEALVNADQVKAQLWGWATSISITDPDVVAVAAALSINLDDVLSLALSIKDQRGTVAPGQ